MTEIGSELAAALEPVEAEDRPPETQGIEPGPALALSGGGYRAMLLHLGGLVRLNELGVLGTSTRLSCVSGGSITGAFLGLKWRELGFAGGTTSGLVERVVQPIRKLASRSVDGQAVSGGLLLPGSVWERVRDVYKEALFKNATLQDLPDGDPRVVLNATNVQSGALWRFMRPYMRDWKVGKVENPTTQLSCYDKMYQRGRALSVIGCSTDPCRPTM